MRSKTETREKRGITMIRESFGTGLTRLAALAFALVASVAIAFAIAPATANAMGLSVDVTPSDEAGEVAYTYDESASEWVVTATQKTGWQFKQWNLKFNDGTTDATSTDNPYRSGDKSSSFVGAIAVFEPETPTPPKATVDPTDAGTVTSAVLAEGGFSYTATANEGWEFDQWNVVYGEGGAAEQVDNPLYVDSNVKEVTAYFKATYKITVTDDGNGLAKASAAEAKPGTKVQLTATPKDRSYVFDKWVSDDVTVEDDAFEMPAWDVAVKATFKKAEPVTTYTITFDANGGTGTMDKQTGEAGATVTLAANAFKRDGYTFDGWNTAKDGKGTAYKDKAEVKLEGDMTLYAQWKSSSSSKLPKTGDTVILTTAIAMMATAIAAGALLVVRRRMG